MTWVSFICLLALSSAVFGGSNYDSYSNFEVFKPKPVAPQPWAAADIPIRPVPLPTTNYGSYDRVESRNLIADLPKAPTLPLSEADILCKGKSEGFVIVLMGGEKFIVCTTDSKGDEVFCPKGLLYNEANKRCERKYNPNPNPCASQPCLNGGRCTPTQYSYQCDCSQGYTGRTCEYDGSVCQQQPCGQAYDSVCQSFHVGSALKHVCILQEGRSYGLTAQQSFPSPCLSGEGLFPLAFGNKGFIMCDGEEMFIQSCPGETIWDSVTKVCVWPEMHIFLDIPMKTQAGAEFEPTKVSTERPPIEAFSVSPQFAALPENVEDSQSTSVDRSSSGGGGGGGDSRPAQRTSLRTGPGATAGGDFQTRFTDGRFQPNTEFRSSGDFQTRFTGGGFVPHGGGIGGHGGRPFVPPFVGTPGQRGFRPREIFPGVVTGRRFDDPFDDRSVRIPVLPQRFIPSQPGGRGGSVFRV